jgi:hypothetical protein
MRVLIAVLWGRGSVLCCLAAGFCDGSRSPEKRVEEAWVAESLAGSIEGLVR